MRFSRESEEATTAELNVESEDKDFSGSVGLTAVVLVVVLIASAGVLVAAETVLSANDSDVVFILSIVSGDLLGVSSVVFACSEGVTTIGVAVESVSSSTTEGLSRFDRTRDDSLLLSSVGVVVSVGTSIGKKLATIISRRSFFGMFLYFGGELSEELLGSSVVFSAGSTGWADTVDTAATAACDVDGWLAATSSSSSSSSCQSSRIAFKSICDDGIWGGDTFLVAGVFGLAANGLLANWGMGDLYLLNRLGGDRLEWATGDRCRLVPGCGDKRRRGG